MILPDRLEQSTITPMQQSFEMGCVPTSVAMVLSGFGITASEQDLAEKYFPSAKLPLKDPGSGEINYSSGVDNSQIINGMVQILESMGLQNQLRIDVFDPWLWDYAFSSQKRYIVKTTQETIRKYGERFKGEDPDSKRVRDFYQTMEALVTSKKICVYTANTRMIRADKMRYTHMLPDNIKAGFYSELADFVRKGHIVGPHRGMTAHTRALDGNRREKIPWAPDEEGYVVLDPSDKSHVIRLENLVWVDTRGVSGDIFDYLIRVSPKETIDVVDPQQYGIGNFLHNFRRLLPV